MVSGENTSPRLSLSGRLCGAFSGAARILPVGSSLCAALLLVCYGAGCDTNETQPGSDHFPLAVGNKWTFSHQARNTHTIPGFLGCYDWGMSEEGEMVWEITSANSSKTMFTMQLTYAGQRTRLHAGVPTPPENTPCDEQNTTTDIRKEAVISISVPDDSMVVLTNPGVEQLCFVTLRWRRYTGPEVESRSDILFDAPVRSNACFAGYLSVESQAEVGIVHMVEAGYYGDRVQAGTEQKLIEARIDGRTIKP